MSFNIVRNDITKVSADAIVNTANPRPVYAGGTDAAIYAAAGAEVLLAERQKIGDIAVGHAAVTSAYALNAKYIIHTVGPEWIDGMHGEREAVRSCYENSLRLAKELGCESIAFPLIATGVYGFPKDEALKIAVSVFSKFLSGEDMEITLVVFDKESFVLSDKVFSGVDEYIDDNYVDNTLDAEYSADLSRTEDICLEDMACKAPSEADFSGSESSPKGGLRNLFGRLGKLGRKNENVSMRESAPKSKAADVFSDEVAEECAEEPCPIADLDDVAAESDAEDKVAAADEYKETETLLNPDDDSTAKNVGRQAAPSAGNFGMAMPEAMASASMRIALSSMDMAPTFREPVCGNASARMAPTLSDPAYGNSDVQMAPSFSESVRDKAAAQMLGSSVAEKKAEKKRSLDDLMANVSETWQESLFRLIDEKGYTDTEVYKRANVDRKLFSKIRSNVDYQPRKITAVAFALALNLNLDETKDLIGRAGYALSPSSRFDLIIEYFIENEVYDTYTINLALFEHDQPLIGV